MIRSSAWLFSHSTKWKLWTATPTMPMMMGKSSQETSLTFNTFYNKVRLESTTKIWLMLTVWPDVGLKCSPIFSHYWPQSSHSIFYLKVIVFSNFLKSHKISRRKYWATFLREFVTQNISKVAQSSHTAQASFWWMWRRLAWKGFHFKAWFTLLAEGQVAAINWKIFYFYCNGLRQLLVAAGLKKP